MITYIKKYGTTPPSGKNGMPRNDAGEIFRRLGVLYVDPFPARLSYFNFHPLEVVGRYLDPQN